MVINRVTVYNNQQFDGVNYAKKCEKPSAGK